MNKAGLEQPSGESGMGIWLKVLSHHAVETQMKLKSSSVPHSFKMDMKEKVT